MRSKARVPPCYVRSATIASSSVIVQLGVGEIVGNPLAQALEQAVRAHGEGDVIDLEITGGEFKPELVFKVPSDHPEVQRLQGRYKSCAFTLTLSHMHRNAKQCALGVALDSAAYRAVLGSDMGSNQRSAQSLGGLLQARGLEVDKIVELQNGGLAKVLSLTEEHVMLDANNMLAGMQRNIEVEVLKIDRPQT